MDKIAKFFKTLSKEERAHLLSVLFPKIKNLELKGLNVKAMKGLKGMYRVRYKTIRILFVKTDGKGVICGIGRRKDVYKK